MRKSIIISLILIFAIKCNSVSSSLSDWEKKYDSNVYWYGTAVIHKTNQENIHKIAREEAINEIATQISVTINNSYNKTFIENNYEIEQNSVTQKLQSQVNNNLEDIEIVEFKDLRNKYILLARLSKNKYYSSVKRKRENAVTAALKYVEKSKDVSFESFAKLAEAKNIIYPYIDYPIIVKYDNQDENLFSLIELKISDMLDDIILEIDYDEKKIKKFINKDPIKVKAINKSNNSRIKNIPLFSNFNNKIDYCVTNNYGECEFFIDESYLSKLSAQSVYFGVDRKRLYSDIFDSSNFKSKINIILEPVNIALNIKDYNFNTTLSQSYIEPVVKEFLVKESNVNFIKDVSKSDLIISIISKTRSSDKAANEYGIFQAFCDSSVDVKFSDKDEPILTLKVTSKGVDFNSIEQAGHKAIEKNSQIIFNETLVDLVSILTQN